MNCEAIETQCLGRFAKQLSVEMVGPVQDLVVLSASAIHMSLQGEEPQNVCI